MISPLDPEAVLGGLGDKFLLALSGSVVAAREDLAAFRSWKPSWFPAMSGRGLSNLIHDRIWDHLIRGVDDVDGVFPHDDGTTREIQVGTNFLLRIKRHRLGNRISTYPTATALGFYLQGEQQALEGLELVTLAAGYRWDSELREILSPVVSYRDGKDNPLWAVELDEPASGATSIKWNPLTLPDLPSVDLGDLGESEETGESET